MAPVLRGSRPKDFQDRKTRQTCDLTQAVTKKERDWAKTIFKETEEFRLRFRRATCFFDRNSEPCLRHGLVAGLIERHTNFGKEFGQRHTVSCAQSDELMNVA